MSWNELTPGYFMIASTRKLEPKHFLNNWESHLNLNQC